MTTAKPIVVARIPMSKDDALHVSVDMAAGQQVIDLRVYTAFTAARAMMPTKRALTFPPAILGALIAALERARLDWPEPAPS